MSQKKLELKQEQVDFLASQPEQGMGYQIVDVLLKDGTVLKQRIVLNSTHLLLEETEDIGAEDIFSMVAKKSN